MSMFRDMLRRFSAVTDRYWVVSFVAIGVAMEFIEHDWMSTPWHRTIGSLAGYCALGIVSVTRRRRRHRRP